MKTFLLPESALLHNARATFYPQPDGSLRLVRVQVFSTPKFREDPDGWERIDDGDDTDAPDVPDVGEAVEEHAPATGGTAGTLQAARRARRRAFDLIQCNHDLDSFATFTYAPDAVGDKSDYSECYPRLKNWLSNGVQRRGLKYICVPELTKAGDVHFHAIANSAALNLEKARNPKNGRLIKHHGDQVYNVTDWRAGFSTAQLIRQRGDDADPRDAVAKYISKYMTKNLGAKIGGRHILVGGDLVRPVYAYGDGVEQFASASDLASWGKWETELPNGARYWEYAAR